MDDIVLTFWEAIGALVVSAGVPIGAIVYILFNLDKAGILVARLAQIFSYFSMRAERHTIAIDIQSKIKACQKDNAIGEIMKHGIKFKWVTDEQNSSYIDGDDVVVIMSHHRNDAENFLNAIVQYAKLAVLPDIQNNIPAKVISPIMLTMQDKIIQEQRPEALPMFRDTIMNVAVKKRPLNKSYCRKFKATRSNWLAYSHILERNTACRIKAIRVNGHAKESNTKQIFTIFNHHNRPTSYIRCSTIIQK